MAAHPVVVGLQAVETDGDAVQAGIDKRTETLRCEIESVAHHPPGEAPLVDATATELQIVAHQRFATRYDDEHLVRIAATCHAVEHAEEVLARHVLLFVLHLAVAAAMAAMQVAAQRTLPEELA